MNACHQAHQDLDFFRAYHDGDPRFINRLDRIQAYLATFEGVVAEVPAVAVKEDDLPVRLPPPENAMSDAEAILQAEALLTEVPVEIGGKKKSK